MGTAAPVFPALPELPVDDSMLSRKFGREVANYFAGNPLNRLSFLRTDHVFLRAAFSHPSARFLLLESLAPTVTEDKPPRLGFVSTDDVVPLTGPDPFVRTEEELIKGYNSEEPRPIVLFLGIDDKGLMGNKGDFRYKAYEGSPYFAVDVTPKGSLADKAKEIGDAAKAKGLSWHTNARSMTLSAGEGTYIYTVATCLPSLLLC